VTAPGQGTAAATTTATNAATTATAATTTATAATTTATAATTTATTEVLPGGRVTPARPLLVVPMLFAASYLLVDLRGDFASGDDGVYVRMARWVADHGRIVPPVEAVAPALSDSYLMALPGFVGADGLVWMRWIGVLLAACTVWMLGDAVRLRTGRWSLAVAAQVVLATSPVHYALAASVMTDMHSLAWFVAAAWALERARVATVPAGVAGTVQRAGRRDRSLLWVVVAAAATVLFVLSRTTGLLFAPLWWWAFRAESGVLAGLDRRRRERRLAGWLLALPAAVFVVVRVVRSRAPGDLLEDEFLRVATERSIGQQVHNLSGLVAVSLLYSALFVAPLALVLVARSVGRRIVVAGLALTGTGAVLLLGASPDARFPFFGSWFTSRSLGIAEFASNPPSLWPVWFANAAGVVVAVLAVGGVAAVAAHLRTGGRRDRFDAVLWLATLASIAVPSAWSGGAPLDRYAVPLVLPTVVLVTTALARLDTARGGGTRSPVLARATLGIVSAVGVAVLVFDVTALRDTFTLSRAVHDRTAALLAEGVDPRRIDAGPGFAGMVVTPLSAPPDLDRRTCLGHWWNAVLSPDSRVDWVFAYTDVPGFTTVERIPVTATWRSDPAILLLRYDPAAGRCDGFDDDPAIDLPPLDPPSTSDG
jgi:hypothetical protein